MNLHQESKVLSNTLTVDIRPTVHYAKVAVDLPIARHFDYAIPEEIRPRCVPGAWVIVPWGKGQKLGIIFNVGEPPELPPEKIRPIHKIVEGAPLLPRSWMNLVEFAATYYHRGLGEVALNGIPKFFKQLDRKASITAFEKWGDPSAKATKRPTNNKQVEKTAKPVNRDHGRLLNSAQSQALTMLINTTQTGKFSTTVLFGVTGSGKTEVYLRWLEHLLQMTPDGQVLMLVPEINLTPALQNLLESYFPLETIAVLHSEIAEGQRATNWLAAAQGRARIVIGTRLAVLTPLPNIAAILIDEEHDPSFKQHEAPHYSARDLAIAFAQLESIPIVLASATPSLETWNAVLNKRYECVRLPERATGAANPDIKIVHLGSEKTLQHGLTEQAVAAIRAALVRKEQALVFINRRGYAPVIHCSACGWLSQCTNCTAYQVLHRKLTKTMAGSPYQLVCHHCAAITNPPRQCPTCGNIDLVPLGRGTQRLEEGLAEIFPEARIARLDRDAAQRKGVAQKIIADAHAGNVDILVGTQMLAKGHDFLNLSEVIVVDSDAALFSGDFRAPERLFSTLMQVSGRAGRAKDKPGRVTIQSRFEDHPLFAYLGAQDYEGFIAGQIDERRASLLPPFSFEALFRLEAKTLELAIEQLQRIKTHGEQMMEQEPTKGIEHLKICDPIPMPVARVAGKARAQLLIESGSRPALHRWLSVWLPKLKELGLRWHIEIDPLEI
jgi:primosomal protein N' (replication factor Y) (superfamily II helicase)